MKKVFYTDRMLANTRSFSPSAGKPKHVVASWQALGVPIEIVEPQAVTRADFYAAHDREYVDGVLDLKDDNGFGNRLPEVAASLSYTSGAMLTAAREAIANGEVAVAPCSGFNHAEFEGGSGFCTFNGLMVTALALRRGGLARRVGILDLDQHYGNGTADIIRKLRTDWIDHFTAGAKYHRPSQVPEFLALLPKLVRRMKTCDVILYQAGADPHIDDPLGSWLTSTQLRDRDRLVFETARKYRIPIAWNLAGGYQEPLRKVLDIHDGTMIECAAVYEGYGAAERMRTGRPDR